MPFYGWIYDPRTRKLSIKVLIDGQDAGSAELGFSRTDVAEGRNLSEANLGFRYDLDFRRHELAFGPHRVEFLVSIDGGEPLLLATRTVTHVDRQLYPSRATYLAPASTAPPLSTDPSVVGWLDGPVDGNTTILYNPIADLWLQFRNLVVRHYVDRFARIAGKSCMPRSKVFSHQIVPSLYGAWDADVLGVDASLDRADSYNPGITLYGGTAMSDGAFATLKLQKGWTRYGVNEMHPITPMADERYLEMFRMHRQGGAAFVAPYYMDMQTMIDPGEGLTRFRIDPSNTRFGSDRFYWSIQRIMTE